MKFLKKNDHESTLFSLDFIKKRFYEIKRI